MRAFWPAKWNVSGNLIAHNRHTDHQPQPQSEKQSEKTAWGILCVRVWGYVGVREQKAKGKRIAGKKQNPIKYSTWQRCENYKANVTFCVCRSLLSFFSQCMAATVYGAVKYRQHGPQWQQCLGPFGCPISPTTLPFLAALLPSP